MKIIRMYGIVAAVLIALLVAGIALTQDGRR